VNILIGNIDLACIYYVTILGDILEKVEWNESDDIRIFFMNIYPFLDVRFFIEDFLSSKNFFLFRKKDWIQL
jgi:hypothetical protein